MSFPMIVAFRYRRSSGSFSILFLNALSKNENFTCSGRPNTTTSTAAFPRTIVSVRNKLFYQVPISDEVGSMFCANLAGTRGKFTSVAMTRLPMGWSYAPAIAQKISNTLLRTADGRILGVAWIDNFIFAGKTEEEVAANYAEFLHRCDEANVKIDILDAKPKSLLTGVQPREGDVPARPRMGSEEGDS